MIHVQLENCATSVRKILIEMNANENIKRKKSESLTYECQFFLLKA